MFAAIKAELRKLLTVRSTYIVILICMAIVALYAGYIEGFKATPDKLHSSGLLASEVTGAVGAVAVFGSVVGLLLFAHEYRYNTIMYTLTSTNSRSKVMVAKIIATTLFIIPFTLFIGVYSPLMTVLGAHLHGLHIVAQTYNYTDLLWQTVFYGWAYAMLALVFVAIIRNQVGAITAFFLFQFAGEGLLGLLLKENVKYLPFTALRGVLGGQGHGAISLTTPTESAGIVAIYLAVLWFVAWALFLRRDAN